MGWVTIIFENQYRICLKSGKISLEVTDSSGDKEADLMAVKEDEEQIDSP